MAHRRVGKKIGIIAFSDADMIFSSVLSILIAELANIKMVFDGSRRSCLLMPNRLDLAHAASGLVYIAH